MTLDSGDKDDGKVTGDVLQYLGPTSQTGVEDDTGVDTYALRFMMRSQPTSTQTFDTSYSRLTWDYAGADEVWFWMDLTDVELKGLSFRLRANEKYWVDWNEYYRDGDYLDEYNRMGDIVYSTKGYTGTDGYVYVQREDGGWDKVNLTNGTIDLGNFRGYVRVPIDFICSETASYANVSNQEIGVGTKRMSGNSVDKPNIDSWLNTLYLGSVLVDPAGTNIRDALLMQHRAYASKSGIRGWGDKHLWTVFGPSTTTYFKKYEFSDATDAEKAAIGSMIAAGLGDDDA